MVIAKGLPEIDENTFRHFNFDLGYKYFNPNPMGPKSIFHSFHNFASFQKRKANTKSKYIIL